MMIMIVGGLIQHDQQYVIHAFIVVSKPLFSRQPSKRLPLLSSPFITRLSNSDMMRNDINDSYDMTIIHHHSLQTTIHNDYTWYDNMIKLMQSWTTQILLLLLLLMSPLPLLPANAADTTTSTIHEWTLGNGLVKLPDPFVISIPSSRFSERSTYDNSLTTASMQQRQQNNDDIQLELTNPKLLGSGSGGAVFAMKTKTTITSTSPSNSFPFQQVAVKISWEASTSSVNNECHILQLMEQQHIPNVEQCWINIDYPFNQQQHRRILILTPVFDEEIVTSITDLSNKSLQQIAIQNIIKTLIFMICNGIVTTDIQPMIGRYTGNILFLDMTEAQQIIIITSSSSKLSTSQPTFVQLALARSFCTEMITLIPDHLTNVATQVLDEQIIPYLKTNEDKISSEIWEILSTQIPFWSSTSQQYLDSQLANTKSI